MVPIDLTGSVALVTGGTQGIGKSAACELASAGADVYVTCKWGSVDESALVAEISEAAGKAPVVVQADVSVDEDTETLMKRIGEDHDHIDMFVSNVGFAPQVNTLADYRKRSLFKTFEYSSWPVIAYTRSIEAHFGSYPKRVIAVSSDGPDHYYRGYDYVSAAKALLEHFTRYLAVHLQPHGSTANVIRFGTVKTPSFDAIFGNEFFDFATSEGLSKELLLSPDECGRAILALASGLLDAMNGQVITVDYGLPFQDNLMMRFLDWKAHKDTQ